MCCFSTCSSLRSNMVVFEATRGITMPHSRPGLAYVLMHSIMTGMRGVAGGCQPAAAKRPCISFALTSLSLFYISVHLHTPTFFGL